MIDFSMALQGITRIVKPFLLFYIKRILPNLHSGIFCQGKERGHGMESSGTVEREAAKASLQRPENIKISLPFQL